MILLGTGNIEVSLVTGNPKGKKNILQTLTSPIVFASYLKENNSNLEIGILSFRTVKDLLSYRVETK